MYDAPNNRFVPVEDVDAKQYKAEGKAIFEIGEVITLRGVDFRVFNVTDKNIILRCVRKHSVRQIA